MDLPLPADSVSRVLLTRNVDHLGGVVVLMPLCRGADDGKEGKGESEVKVVKRVVWDFDALIFLEKFCVRAPEVRCGDPQGC